MNSFRPLSGSYISQSFFEWAANEGYMFPSPIGELHFSIGNHFNHTFLCHLFPSPIGELHFSIMYEKRSAEIAASFRPLSGSYISQ